jgi:serine/threonine-protein kinase
VTQEARAAGEPQVTILERRERYLVFDRLASGGMASVHLGVAQGALGFSRMVAVKRLHPQFARNPRFVSMLKQEARLAARIRHANVVQVLDILEVKGEVLAVMEYVRGVALDALVRAQGDIGQRLPAEYLVPILAGALRVLHAAHEATDWDGKPLGIVHRDFSPQNILVGVGGIPRVIDFGVAKALGHGDLTRDDEFKGKLAYAAPEQLTGGLISRQADVFAAGVVLWELLAGAPLFRGATDAETFGNVLRRQVEDPLAVAVRAVPALDPAPLRGLAAVALRALERDPGKRFATSADMAQAIEGAHAGAATSELGSWVERLGAEQLAHEHAMVRELERYVASDALASGSRITIVEPYALGAAPHSAAAVAPRPWGWLAVTAVATCGAAIGAGLAVAALLR